MQICVLGSAKSNHVVARAKVFADFGHDVTFVSPINGDALGLDMVCCSRDEQGKLSWLKSVLLAVRRAKADVYHAHYAAELTTWAAWLLGKRPLVITVMGGDVLFDEQGSLGLVGRWLTKRSLRAADLVTVKSPLLGEVVAGFGVPRERIMDVVWGVDARVFKPEAERATHLRAAWGIGANEKILFSPRMLKPLYNQMLMIEALPRILGTIPDARLVISTYQEDRVYRTNLEARALELQVAERVNFVPGVPPSDMAAGYSAADVVLSLPPSDGTPQSVMEAMACGAPVVMTDLDRFKPFFSHGETCCFTTLDAASVADTVVQVLSDKALSARLSTNGRALVAKKADFETQSRAVEARLKLLAVRA